MSGEAEFNVSKEAHLVGLCMPDWLFDELASGDDNLLILHPNEGSRQFTINRLRKAGVTPDTSKHLTFPSLWSALHHDLRLPRILTDNAALFTVVHEFTKRAADNLEMPLVHSGANPWTVYKSERIASLHKELMGLVNPWRWSEDPGVKEFNRVLLKVEDALGGTHPDNVAHRVLNALKMSDDKPFTTKDVKGMYVLDFAPDFKQVEASLLQQLSRFTPIHHLCASGNFRIGHHGAFIVDEGFITESELPDWVAQHEVQDSRADVSHWRLAGATEKQSSHHRFVLKNSKGSVDAGMELVQAYLERQQGTVLLIDADSTRHSQWRTRLSDIGIEFRSQAHPLIQSRAVAALLEIANLGRGIDAWSLENILSLSNQSSLPIDLQFDLEHPTRREWKPRLHKSVIENLARSFHVRGGHGALSRWFGVLANARPSISQNQERAGRELEETQWWIACIASLFSPFLAEDEKALLGEELTGCYTGEELLLPSPLVNGQEWFDEILSRIDWGNLIARDSKVDDSIQALQILIDEFKFARLQLENAGLETHSLDFISLLEICAQNSKTKASRADQDRVVIATPESAFGVEADLAILVGLDADSWSMRKPVIPWLDVEARRQLGILDSDLIIRQGRHHLRHLLNCASCVIVFDTSLDEAAPPSAPLAEWLQDIRVNGELDGFRSAPFFLYENEYRGEDIHRPWHFITAQSGEGSWLAPRSFSMQRIDGRIISSRSGKRARDDRQRLGLALSDGYDLEGLPNVPTALSSSKELDIYLDRLERQPSFPRLEKGDEISWQERAHLVTFDDIVLRPSAGQIANLRTREDWPTLGYHKGNSKSQAIDPRPLPMPQYQLDLDGHLGPVNQNLLSPIWSASRIQTWLACPRQAWLSYVLKADGDEQQDEDLDMRVRGDIVHECIGALLEAHGVEFGGGIVEHPQDLISGPIPTLHDGHQTILAHLEQDVPWLGRADAVAYHRCRDLLGITPSQWREYLEGGEEILLEGRIGGLLTSEYALRGSMPIACEWRLSNDGQHSVCISGQNDSQEEYEFQIRGRIDRVDQVELSEEGRARAIADGLLCDDEEVFPLCSSQTTPSKRWVIIRDYKSIEGPKASDSGDRHRRGLFEDVQLALYARAWEIANPGDRVIGVGLSEVGEYTTHYVELDTSVSSYLEGTTLGSITTHSASSHRLLDEDQNPHSSGFRAWMAERIRTSIRAIQQAESGIANPVISKGCKYCRVASACALSQVKGGESF